MRIPTLLAAFAALARANLDVVTLSTRGTTYITSARATLVLGKAPSPQGSGDAALWSAIMMDKQDFLQGVTQNSKAE